MVCVYIIIIFLCIFRINNYRIDYIKEQLDDDNKNIKVIRNPITYVWNNNPNTEYFIRTYKGYMHIPDEVSIEIDEIPYSEYVDIILGVK